MAYESGPQPLARALAELIALRGYARSGGDAQLQQAWCSAAGPLFSRQSRALAVKRGVLQVAVAHSPLLSELASFHKQTILQTLQSQHPDLKIRDLKFKLDSEAGQRAPRSA